MNSIRQIQALNKRELENNVSPEASWHVDYRDTAWIYIGGLPFDLSEGDIVTIFSQYGEPVHVNLVRDKETGKSRGFAFLKYEDQRSTDLAVDNLGGATVMGRLLRVDHTRYKRKDEEELENNIKNAGRNGEGQGVDGDEGLGSGRRSRSESKEPRRPMLKEERELAALMQDHDDEDPMKEYLIQEKKEEVAAALANLKKSSHKPRDGREKSHRHRRRSRDRSYSGRHIEKDRHRSRSRETRQRGDKDNDRSRSRERKGHRERHHDR